MRQASAPNDLAFPPGFLWGTATSAHQVEGDQDNDWTEWEAARCPEVSGAACDHYRRYEHDIELLAGLGFNCYRFSLEWSRIEPDEGSFSRQALDHYRAVAECCRRYGMAPIVTFHHFTNPKWIARRGAWEDPATPELFARYCGRTASHLAGSFDQAITINEPNMPALLGYELGWFPPGKQDVEARVRATRNFIRGHRLARDEIRARCEAQVGWALAMTDFQALPGGEATLEEIRGLREDVFLDAAESDDFIGVNAYTRHRVDAGGVTAVEEGIELTDMEYEFWPAAVEATVRRANEMLPHLPVIVSESGIGTSDDSRRIVFIAAALEGVLRCLRDGIDVRGFIYWSALDNFEWTYGYTKRFGLIEVDRTTQERRVKPSGHYLGEIAARNRLLQPSDR